MGTTPSTRYSDNQIDFNLSSSNYVNLTGRRICIDDRWNDLWPYNTYNYLETPDVMTWTELESSVDWCSGSGTTEDPYVIKDIYLDCQNLGAGISIFNSNVHFIIRNCYIINSGIGESHSGISLIHVYNGLIKNNTFLYDYEAVWLQYSSHNRVNDNKMFHDTTTYGEITAGKVIRLVSSDSNIIYRNRALDYYDGIYLRESNYNIITENFIETNKFGHFPDTGILLDGCNCNIISFNIFAGDYAKYSNPHGEFIISQQVCVGNIIENYMINSLTALSILGGKFEEFNSYLRNTYTSFTLHNSNYNFVYRNQLYT